MTDAPDLKPCPFCGGEAALIDHPDHSTAFYVGCQTDDCLGLDHWAESSQEAIRLWNTRADQAAREERYDARIDALTDDLCRVYGAAERRERDARAEIESTQSSSAATSTPLSTAETAMNKRAAIMAAAVIGIGVLIAALAIAFDYREPVSLVMYTAMMLARLTAVVAALGYLGAGRYDRATFYVAAAILLDPEDT